MLCHSRSSPICVIRRLFSSSSLSLPQVPIWTLGEEAHPRPTLSLMRAGWNFVSFLGLSEMLEFSVLLFCTITIRLKHHLVDHRGSIDLEPLRATRMKSFWFKKYLTRTVFVTHMKEGKWGSCLFLHFYVIFQNCSLFTAYWRVRDYHLWMGKAVTRMLLCLLLAHLGKYIQYLGFSWRFNDICTYLSVMSLSAVLVSLLFNYTVKTFYAKRSRKSKDSVLLTSAVGWGKSLQLGGSKTLTMSFIESGKYCITAARWNS